MIQEVFFESLLRKHTSNLSFTGIIEYLLLIAYYI